MRIILLLLCVWSLHGQRGPKKCAHPELARGFIVPQRVSYEHDSVVHYGCDKGLKPAIKSWWAELKCDNSKWSHTPECIPQSACIATEVLHAQPKDQLQRWYSNNTEVDYVCDSSHKFAGTDKAICTDGKWTLPECRKKEHVCDPPGRVDNAVILEPYKDVFEHRARITYICKHGYKMEQRYTECYLGKWTPEVKCAEDSPAPEVPKQSVPPGHTDEDRSSARETLREDHSTPILISDSRPSHVSLCRTYPTIEHGDVFEQPDGMALHVQCAMLYKLDGTNQVKCVNGEWTALPVCKAPCKVDQTLFHNQQPEYIQHGDHRQEYCRGSWYQMYYKCNNGQTLYYGCGRRDW